MGQRTVKDFRRELRKALSAPVADLIEQHQIRISAHAQILRRGFWGRLKWLVTGR